MELPIWSATWVARAASVPAPERMICVATATSQLALMPNRVRYQSPRPSEAFAAEVLIAANSSVTDA